jgi:hypothetical protein
MAPVSLTYPDVHLALVYPPMQSPFLTLNKDMVGPLLSHREWKSLPNHPCSDPE